jgi:hypothetical protein
MKMDSGVLRLPWAMPCAAAVYAADACEMRTMAESYTWRLTASVRVTASSSSHAAVSAANFASSALARLGLAPPEELVRALDGLVRLGAGKHGLDPRKMVAVPRAHGRRRRRSRAVAG